MENIVQLEKVFNYIHSLETNKFYGKILLSLNGGKVTNMKMEASLDLSQFKDGGDIEPS
jgi:hypothetical protein